MGTWISSKRDEIEEGTNFFGEKIGLENNSAP
jgi:hypothetical protein